MDSSSKFYDRFNRIIEYLLGVFVVLMIGIVFIQVIYRYVFKLSLAGVEELPRYFMIICVYLGSALLVRSNRHVKIDLINMVFTSKRVLTCVEVLNNVICTITLIAFTYLSFDYVKFIFESGDKTAGLGIPLWIIMGLMLVGGILMSINFIMNTFVSLREVKRQWK